MKNYLFGLGVIFVCGVSYGENVYTPLLIQCGGPDGEFVLQTDPDSKTVAFKLNEQGHVTQGNTKIPAGAQGQFEVTSHPPTRVFVCRRCSLLKSLIKVSEPGDGRWAGKKL